MDIVLRDQIPLAPARARSTIYPEGWVLHWVGGSNMRVAPSLEQSKATMRNLQTDAFNRNYNDFEYNFGVDPVGNIFEGRGWSFASGANGTTSSNQHLWAIVYIAGPGVPLTSAAKTALLWLTQEGSRRNSRCTTVTPHRNVYGVSTFCPGDECAAFCPELQARLFDPDPQPPHVPVPKPPTTTRSKRMFIVTSPNKPLTLVDGGTIRVFADTKTLDNFVAQGVPHVEVDAAEYKHLTTAVTLP